ncbi:hypothetical protein DKM44_09780 [Deinococcus irradiatisoli]|uniref:Uncharacterized protein n=1 Tax=Deinococcus irradiatisoli TaxID=2202254 RepID=A0A2Z3JE77_9DEIO|nr:hypothetical protein [Deinococcus irradiatisoli]AWN23477.1 hypothetical protein DKM44_09780 [Deinococcus irradiatisoli]
MTTQPYQPLPAHPLPARWQTSPLQNVVTLLVGFWLMTGIFVDGWAHNHLGERLETFFTPWHAVFYSGFAATALWIGWLGAQGRRQGRRGLSAFPVGYELGAIGVVVFALGGLGDMTWHIVFGIEVGIDALLSPTHLLLFLGAELLVLSPLVACWKSPGGRMVPAGVIWPATLSMTAALSFASFMHMYAWALLDVPSAVSYQGARSLVMSTLLTSLMLSAPVLLLLRRWALPFGAVGLMYGLNTTLMFGMAVGPTDMLPRVALLALLSGLFADLLIRWWRPAPQRPWVYRAFAAAQPLLLWVPFFIGASRLGLLDASLELWTGACVMAALGGLALSSLIVPPSVPQDAA